MNPSGSGTSANLHVLEACMVVIMLFTAITFVFTFEQPTNEDTPIREKVRTLDDDVLTVLHERTPPDDSAQSDLAYRIAREVQGDKHLTWYLERLIPQQEMNFHVSNGEGLYPVIDNGQPPGEAVSASEPFTPGWKSLYAAPDLAVYDGETPMYVSAYPVSYSHNMKLPGEAIIVEAKVLEAGGAGETKTYQVHEQAALPEWEEESPAVYAKKESDFGTKFGLAYTADQRTYACSALTYCNFKLIVNETANQTLPVGTDINIQIPHGWSHYPDQPDNADWVNQHTEGTSGPFSIHATLNQTLQNDTTTFEFNLVPEATIDEPFSTFGVTLSNESSESRTELVIPNTDVTEKAPRQVHTSIPYPVNASSRSVWGVAFSNGLDAVEVQKITLKTGHGTPLFKSISTKSGIDGSWSINGAGTQATWTPDPLADNELLSGEALDLLFKVNTTPRDTWFYPELDRTTPRVTFGNGYTHNLTRQRESPGVYAARIPAASSDSAADGYPHDGNRVHEAKVTFFDPVRNANLSTTLTYEVDEGIQNLDTSVLLDQQSALTSSHLQASPMRVTPDERVHLRANLTSLLSTVAELGGTNVHLSTQVYAPPSITNEPVVETNTTLQGAPRPAVTAVHGADVTGDTVPDVVLGSTDDHVYLATVDPVSLDASVLWSKDVGSDVGSVTTMEGSLGAPWIVVGTADGKVVALDGAGSVQWSDTLADTVTGLQAVPNPGSVGDDLVAVSQEGERWTRYSTGGSIRSTLAPGADVTSVGHVDGDTVIGLADGSVIRRTPTGTQVWRGVPDATNVVCLGVGDVDSDADTEIVSVHGSLTIVELTSGNGSMERTGDMPGGGDPGAVGCTVDASGDAVPDVLAVTTDGKVVFENLATDTGWTASLDPVPKKVPMEEPTFVPPPPNQDPIGSHQHTVWGVDVVTSAAGPRITVTYTVHGTTSTGGFDAATGDSLWTKMWNDDAGLPQCTATPQPVAGWYVVGTDGGRVVVVDSTPRTEATPITTQQSTFLHTLYVPLGAFYGGHLAVVDVTWDSAIGGAQSASLHTTFDVVPNEDANPLARFVYDAHFTTWFDDW